MLERLFSTQKEHINHFFEQVDRVTANACLDVLNHCSGTIFLSGVGKSGLISKKIAQNMTSVGVKALYLSPLDALHGDIGILSEGDVFILISKSGESDELLHLLPFLRNKGVTLIAWVCEAGSRIGKACDMEVILPMQEELCPLGMMPTTSSAIQLIFGDILAVALMELRGIDEDAYQKNHPAGKIGRRMTLRVSDLMLYGEAIPKTKRQSRVVEQLVQLSDKRCGCLLIVDENDALEGIFTDGDLRRSLQQLGQEALNKTVGELMTPTAKSIHPEAMVTDARALMEENQKRPVMVLPVVSDEKVVGLIKMHDILQSGV